MKIAHIITRLIPGGADENTVLNCNAQVDAGHDVLLIIGNENSPEMMGRISPRVKTLVVRELVRTISPLQDISAVVKVQSEFKKFSPDIVHTHTSKAGVIGRIAAVISSVPVIIHGLHIVPFANVGHAERLIYSSVERFLDIFTHGYTSVSPAVTKLYEDASVVPPSKVATIKSGMDIEKFRNSIRSKLRDEPQHSSVRVAYVAALEKRKNHRFLIEVASQLRETRENWTMHFFGDGPLRLEIEEQISSLGLNDRVFLEGYKRSIENDLASMDVAVFCSTREGLPRSLVQCVGAGLPIVMLNLPGAETLVENGVNGFIVTESSLFKDRLMLLLQDVELRKSFSNASEQRDLSSWSLDRMIKTTLEYYEVLLSKKLTPSIDTRAR